MTTDNRRWRVEGKELILGVTGSIAAYKAAHLARLLVKGGARVRVILTEAGARFVTVHTFSSLSGARVYTELFEASPDGQPPHLMLAESADALVIAPASADFIARMAAGMGNDLLACVCLAVRCPILLAPAMHHQMWRNPLVQANVDRLKAFGHEIIGPEEGDLACGDVGAGRMVEPESIMEIVARLLCAPR